MFFKPDTVVSENEEDIFSLFKGFLKADYGIWLWEPYTHTLYFNNTYLTMLGYAPGQFPYHITTWENLIHPEDWTLNFHQQMQIIETPDVGESFETRFRLKTATGDYMWVLSRGFVVCRDDEGKAIRLVGIHIDTETSESIVKKLAVAHDRMRFALEAARDGIWDWTPSTGEVYFSPRYIAMCGYKPDEFPQRVEAWIERVHPDDLDATVKKQFEFIESPELGDMFECIYRFRTASGDYKWILGRGKATRRDENGRAERIVGLHTDITELRHTQESLAHLINHDTLTGLYSRFYFDEQLAALQEEHYPVSIIYGDVDGLKLINDYLGHVVGDTLLKTAASLIRQGTRANDIVSRTGGDEFTILLLRCSEPAARQVLERIRIAMDLHNAAPDAMPVFLSFGLVSAARQTSVNKLVTLADRKMIAEKAKNRPVNLAAIRQWIEARTGVSIDVFDTRIELQ